MEKSFSEKFQRVALNSFNECLVVDSACILSVYVEPGRDSLSPLDDLRLMLKNEGRSRVYGVC